MANAARVKSLELTDSDCSNTATMTILSVYSPKKPLFPNIRCLDWSTVTEDENQIFTYGPLFLSSKLQRLTIRKEDDGDRCGKITSLLKAVKHMHPPLKHLFLENFALDDPAELSKAAGDLVCASDLTEFEGDCWIPTDAILHLARSASLKTVDLKLRAGVSWERLLDDTDESKIFPALQEIALDVSGLAQGCGREIILKATSRQLQTVSISLRAIWPTGEDVYQFFVGLAALPNPVRIRTLSFVSPYASLNNTSPLDSHPERVLGLGVFQPLYAMPFLTHLTVTNRYLDVDDEFIRQFVLHFPALESFYLLPGYFDNIEPRATLLSLMRVASGLLCIREFGFPFRPTAPLPLPFSYAYNQSCKTIIVGYAPLTPDEIDDTALFISAHFWRYDLKLVMGTPVQGTRDALREREVHRKAWKKCQAQLPLLSRARYQERNRYGIVPHNPPVMSYVTFPRRDPDAPPVLWAMPWEP